MNIANRLTVLRMVLAFVFMFFLLYCTGLWAKIVSLIIFTIAALSDFFDGFIAKRRNMITDFGKLMDPIADKVLVLAAFVAFIQMQLVNSLMVLIIIFREILITSLRLFALNKGRVLSAARAGKHKTLSQMLVIFFILGFIVFKEIMITFFTWNPNWEKAFRQGIDVIMWFIVVLTLYSGVSYLWENRKIISSL
ncbi:MAG: CDP-diacylglycerol--glycerol-3-phosphate 3-phosphatidyltransferase [Candidatus Omnitrophica bacterium]|nr:CDP-diacylglycerol--glycerol-3-phosphate 3-phosphatidyltransferase [Candidatus Omnitrophota bacterium]